MTAAGIDPARGRCGSVEDVARLAVRHGTPRLYSYLTGRRNLQLLASYDRSGAGPEVIDEALEMVELRDRAGDRVSE